jgi:hypothetical protein
LAELKKIQQNGYPINSQQAVPSPVAQCIGLMILHGEVAECQNHGNLVRFKPVTTDALKLEVQLPKDNSAGIYEWNVK